MDDSTEFQDYNTFAERIGILSEEKLTELGWECDNGNRICFSKLEKLLQFVDHLNYTCGEEFVMNAQNIIEGKEQIKPKRYHIATDLDVNELEETYCSEKGIDPEENELKVVGTFISNSICYVNRMDYFLCDGDDNPNLVLKEIEEI